MRMIRRRRQLWALQRRRRSFREGVLGGSRFWQAIGLVVYGRQALRKITRPGPEFVARERLDPGQFVTIRAIDPRREQQN